MQKEIFQKLVAKLDEQCDNCLIGSEIDYRRLIAKRSIDQVSMKANQLSFPCVSVFMTFSCERCDGHILNYHTCRCTSIVQNLND